MFDLIIESIGYMLLAVFWLSVLLLGWAAWRAGRARRWVRCALFCLPIGVLLWFGLLLGFTPGAAAYQEYRFVRSLFGQGHTLGPARFTYDGPRAFNGDGYSITVYDLPDTLLQIVSAPPPEFLARYPIRPSARAHWSGTTWRQTPISPSELKFLEFALQNSNQPAPNDFYTTQALLKRLAQEPGHYFAYFYTLHGDHVDNIDFFLVSPDERVLILVNHNT